ncbi:unnamed protein product, partial [Mesorhabditis spiculigera]
MPNGMLVRIFCLLSAYFGVAYATGCYRCVSKEDSLDPITRIQIRNQIDTFFVPVEARSPGCSQTIDEDTPNVELQLCSVFPYCVTLMPNVPNSTYVVRGCFELTLRSNLRENQALREAPGCFLIKSRPGVPANSTLNYIVCICEGDYCNYEPIPHFEDISYMDPRKPIQRLANHNGTLQFILVFRASHNP